MRGFYSLKSRFAYFDHNQKINSAISPRAQCRAPSDVSSYGLLSTAHQVIYANLITVPETATVSCSVRARKMRVPVFVAIINIRRAMIFRILTRAFDAIVKSLPF